MDAKVVANFATSVSENVVCSSPVPRHDRFDHICNISWTQGACPQAGVDIEPSSEAEPLHNITLRNLLLQNNTGAGLQVPVDAFALLPGGLPLSLALDRIHVWGANWSATRDGCSSSGLGIVVGPMRSVGVMTLSNSRVEHLPSAGLLVEVGRKYDTVILRGDRRIASYQDRGTIFCYVSQQTDFVLS